MTLLPGQGIPLSLHLPGHERRPPIRLDVPGRRSPPLRSQERIPWTHRARGLAAALIAPVGHIS